jgi:peptidoglycan-N-acetylglucosamine deacetylase
MRSLSPVPSALTFDDGPHPQRTARLLDVLARFQVQATFFWLGSRIRENRVLLQRAIAEGHECGNHSWSHSNFARLSESAFDHELRATDSMIAEIAGARPRYLRPPFGMISLRQRAYAKERFGYDVVLWNVDAEDWRRPGIRQIADTIRGASGSGRLVLLHDIYDDTVSAVELALSHMDAPRQQFSSVTRVRKAFSADPGH